jgi:hypothetical protein
MQKLKTNFKRYRWLLLLIAGVAGVFGTGGEDARRQLPPGTDLISAIVTLYALARKEREHVAEQVVERIWHKLGEVVTTTETNKQDVTDLRTVVAGHAGNIEYVQQWGHNWGPAFEMQPVLRPAAR